MFDELSKKIGFTKTEIKVILFLIITFICGFIIKFYNDSNLPSYRNFDYSVQDSIFLSLKNNQNNIDSTGNSAIDNKQEVLEFRSNNFKRKESLPLLEENSIDINSADKKLLMRLPGIGPATAKNIIELRNIRGKFGKIEELLDVKGIGISRFKKIEKFLYIK